MTAACLAALWNPSTWNLGLVLVLMLGIVLLSLVRARRGRLPRVRRIAGVRAMEEAVGRATEMGKPVFFVTGFIYRVATITGRSATWGMRLMAMEIRRGDDRPFDGGTALLHTLGYSVSLAFPVLQVISVVLMLTSERRQGLTDMVLGTVPLNCRR